MHNSQQPIGFWSAVAMGIGAMVGAGIFALLGEASAISGSAVYLSFIIGGVIALLSGYSLGKLGARGLSIRLVCEAFGINETCYRYRAVLSDENAEIADWLVRLTHNRKDRGFGLCRDYLRNVKGFGWDHKRI